MSTASPTSEDGPSMTDQVVSRAVDTVEAIHKASLSADSSDNRPAKSASKRSVASSSLSPPPPQSLASPTSRGVGKRATKPSPAEGETGVESMSRCLVYCRLRPSNKLDFQDGATNIVSLPNGHRVVIKDERHYDYDGTFDPKATQEDVFASVAVPCIQHAFKGFCSALMCYGQTGTGKSYTMCNTDAAHAGIIPRAAAYIFKNIADLASEHDDGRCYTVVGQFVHIYRDHLEDLMIHDGRDRVDIHYDPIEGVSLTGCTSHTLTDKKSFMRFYTEGNARRVVTATAMNPESSRGHTAMVIHIASEHPDDPMKGRTKGKITFIDLAGYERFSKTGITSDNPIMKDEAKTINASLLALGHVVSSLSSGSKHIPWRNSKLTRILQDSIGGRSRTSIILTIGPSSNHLYETTNSLQFGLRAMAVKVRAKVSVTVDYEKLANKLMGLLDERDARINVLELQIANRDAERQELLDRYQQDRADLEARFEKELEDLTAAGATEEQIGKLKEVHHVEVQNLQDQQAEELDYQDEQHSKEINKLINEQKHQEAKSLTAMRLAQESIVEDFQQKLEHAREGTNDDLIHALQQLSEKDAILATRASDTARLHEHITTLTDQVRNLHAKPAEANADFPITFLDIAQVEEMKTRLDGEIERLRNKVVDLQTQLDRVTLICSDRSGEIGNLLDENQQLRQQLQQTGAEMKDSTMELQRLKAKRAEMVDSSELETLRLRMQADMDELASQKEELRKQLEKSKDDLKAAAAAARGNAGGSAQRAQRNLHSTLRHAVESSYADGTISDTSGSPVNYPDEVSEGSSAFPESGQISPLRGKSQHGGGGFSKVSLMRKVYKKSMRKLTHQLAQSCATKTAQQNRIEQLEAMLDAHGVSLPESLNPPESVGNANCATRAAATDGTSDNGQGIAGPTLAIDPDITAILQIRDDEAEAQDQVLIQQEKLLTQGRTAHNYNEQLVSTLTVQLQAAGLTPQEPSVSLQPFETLPLDDYTALLREIRHANRKAVLALLVRATSSPARDEDPTGVDAEALRQELEERDNQQGLKDELLLEKAAVAQYMAKISGRLISQMETLGLTPCCTIPESFQEIADTEVDQLEVQTEKQRELEGRLQREEEERNRMNRLLNAISAEREHQSLILRQTEAKNKELEEREGRAARTIHRLAEEKTQREKILEQTVRRVTRELMETQARLAESETERKSSLFERLFGRKAD